jgi:hypothetical protein
MIGSTWNVVFVAIAMGAGMFAQQAAHKVSAASEDKQVNSLVGLELFCSAEGYYLAGRFNGSPRAAQASPASPVLQTEEVQPLVAASDPPPDAWLPQTEPAADTAPPALELAAATEAPAMPAVPEALPAAETPAVPAGETPIEASAAADAVPAPTATEPPMPEALAGPESNEPPADMPEADAPKPAGDALAADQAAEVLPPPAPDVEPRVGGDNFGKFADEPSYTAPPRSSIRPPLPAGMAAPAGRTYLDATAGHSSRYATPSDLVRDRAVARGEQRRQRIETRKWLGISPLRPAVDSTPYTTVEQPAQLLLVVPDTSSTLR